MFKIILGIEKQLKLTLNIKKIKIFWNFMS